MTKHLDEGLITKLAQHGLTGPEIGAIMGCNRRLIEVKYKEVLHLGREHLKGSLRKKQVELALEGHTGMLVWLGKQLLGQKEKADVTMHNDLAEIMGEVQKRIESDSDPTIVLDVPASEVDVISDEEPATY